MKFEIQSKMVDSLEQQVSTDSKTRIFAGAAVGLTAGSVILTALLGFDQSRT